ncbi:hypothetical protein ACVIVD_005611 [Bradyrhizobium liaoningense]
MLDSLVSEADAILDRLVHNAHRLQLTGESMRKRSAKTITLDPRGSLQIPPGVVSQIPPPARQDKGLLV